MVEELAQTQVVMKVMMMTRWRQYNGAALLLLSQPWMSQSVPEAVLSKFCGVPSHEEAWINQHVKANTSGLSY